MKKSIIFFSLLTITICGASSPKKATYYYVDAINLDVALSETDKEERLYFYSHPIHHTSDDLNTSQIVDKFKEYIKTNYKITSLQSCVLRVNESYDEVMQLRDRSIDKYKGQNYKILKIEGIY
jgi:hypothetical protein